MEAGPGVSGGFPSSRCLLRTLDFDRSVDRFLMVARGPVVRPPLRDDTVSFWRAYFFFAFLTVFATFLATFLAGFTAFFAAFFAGFAGASSATA